MTTSNLDEFERIMQALNEVYGDPNKPVNDIKMRLYFKALEDLTIDELNVAVINLMKSKTFHVLPTPAEIREAAQGSIEEKAEIAFESMMQTKNFYSSVEYEDGTIGKVIEALGGYDVICDWKEADRKWNRVEFIRLYKLYDARGPWPSKKFVGAIEAHNGPKGFLDNIPPVLKIQDANKEILALPEKIKELKQ